jgi:transposase
MEVSTIGIDIGKSCFHFVGFDRRGAIVIRRRCSRTQLIRTLSNLPRCLIGMEACCGAHHLGRILITQGHDVRLIPPQFVRPFVKSQKNDLRDAEAIGEAVQRPTMRFAPLKTVSQLDVQALHRVRTRLIARRTGVINQLRGLLLERGVTFPVGRRALGERLPAVLENPAAGLSPRFCRLVARAVRRHHRLRPHRLGRWMANLEARAHPNVVVVALANKLARTAWAVLQRDARYDGRLLSA